MDHVGGEPPNPFDPRQLATYLAEHPFEAEALIWTLNLDATPIYAIAPGGTFAHLVYEELRRCFAGQMNEGVDIVSIPGAIAGSVRLFSGQVVPLIVPARRGIFGWATQPLVESLIGERPDAKKEQEHYDRRIQGLNNFLSRIYFDLRNLGLTPQDRALNYAATNAFQVAQVMHQATQGDYELDSIEVHKSPVCRPDSDCYDVELAFYNPQNVLVANRVYRFTVDVSDVIPVTIGEVRAWSKRA
jgi:cyanobactin maturation PatA/PatG family protease